MPDRARAPEVSDQQEAADDDYFAPIALARYMRLTTFKRGGVPVSALVHGAADGDRAYFRARNGSETVKRLRHTDAVQVMPCGALGFFTYGPPHDAIARRLSGEEASALAVAGAHATPPR
jgi:PPOX class probable F420-dependent enzyme